MSCGRPPHTSTLVIARRLGEGRASATRPQLAPCDSRKRAIADSQALHTRTSRPGPAWQSPFESPWPWPASALRTSAKPALCPAHLVRPQGINQPVKASTTPATHHHARPCTTGGPTSRRLSRTLSEQQRGATAAASSSNSSEQQQQQRTTAASSRSEQQRAAATPSSEQQQQGTAAAAAIRSIDRSSSSELYIPTHTSVRAYLPQRNLQE